MPANPVVRHIVTFGRVLREVGIEVGPGRVADALRGLDSVGLERQDDVYWTLRQTLVSRPEDLESFDIAFNTWFLGAEVTPLQRRTAEQKQGERRKGGEPGPGPESDGGETSVGGWNAKELLRTKDFGSMTADELAQASKLIQKIAAARPRRRTRRLRPDSKGTALDVRGLVRASLSTGGDPVQRAFRSRGEAPRKLVLILDVSGSMDAYARAMLLYMHAARGAGSRVEAFAFGTRLTRLTPELGSRDPETAFAAAAARVIDWSGGTRIGESLKAYNDEWGRRVHAQRGRHDPLRRLGARRAELSFEMGGLRGEAFAVVWPAQGHELQPQAGGCAALPAVDAFFRAQHRKPRRLLGGAFRHRAEEARESRRRGRAVTSGANAGRRDRRRGRLGPTPDRPKFAVSKRAIRGSVSGGCVERDDAEEAVDVIASCEPKLLTYVISDDDALGVGLPCGGEIDVFVERFE